MARRNQHSAKKRERERQQRERAAERLTSRKQRGEKPGGPEVAEFNPSQSGFESEVVDAAEAEVEPASAED